MKQCRLTSNFSKSTRTGRQNATVVWKHSDLSTMLTQQSTSIQKRRLTKPHNRPHMAVKSVWRIPPIAYAKKRRQTRALWFRTALFWDIESFTFPQVREWGNEQKNERGGASKQSKQCRANKWVSGVSERASRWASGPLLTFRFMLMEPQCRGLRPPPFPPFFWISYWSWLGSMFLWTDIRQFCRVYDHGRGFLGQMVLFSWKPYISFISFLLPRSVRDATELIKNDITKY